MNMWTIVAIIIGAYVLVDIIIDIAIIIALEWRGIGLADIAMYLRHVLFKK